MDIQENSIEEYRAIVREYWKRYAVARGVTEPQAAQIVAVCISEGTFKNIDAAIRRAGGTA